MFLWTLVLGLGLPLLSRLCQSILSASSLFLVKEDLGLSVVLTGSQLGRHGVTKALNCTMSDVGNLKASKGASSTLPEFEALPRLPMMVTSVGHLQIFISGVWKHCLIDE